jgi:hypothetical protein
MQIHVARHSAQLGVFTPEEIIAGLASGRFLPGDLAWRDGQTTWTPLGDWPEFRAAGVPPTPGAPLGQAPVASTIPWEQGKSLGSFFATCKLAIVQPAALATGRFAFGDWLIFCYVALALTLPFQVAHILLAGDQNAAVAAILGKFDHPQLKQMADQMAATPETPLAIKLISMPLGLAMAPLIYAGCGLIHWVGQRLFRFSVSVERTTAATLLACGVVILLGAPFQLLGFDLTAQLVLSALLFIPVCVIYYRAFGAATGVSPWVQFGISSLIWFVILCCCCVGPIMVLAASFAKL